MSDFNQQLFDQLNLFLKKTIPVQFTKSYEASETFEGLDLRNCIHPKNPISLGNELVDFPSYIQVFNDRFEFVPNLSIFDLLFNLGPKAGDYLDNLLITSV
ncbi:MAG: WbqC family protein [Bacteroidetes bacterium]|nr:WbqC family protein [Bacteroidota bacterium]